MKICRGLVWEDYTIGAASYFDTNVLLQLNFVTMMDLCFKKVLKNTTKSL